MGGAVCGALTLISPILDKPPVSPSVIFAAIVAVAGSEVRASIGSMVMIGTSHPGRGLIEPLALGGRMRRYRRICQFARVQPRHSVSRCYIFLSCVETQRHST